MIRHCLEGIDEILQPGFFSTGHIEEQILISGLQKGGKDRRDQHRQVGDQHPCRVLWNHKTDEPFQGHDRRRRQNRRPDGQSVMPQQRPPRPGF
ncbi:MAG: hypothetical protein V8S73_12980 [Lachnospiraceae bacterium]